MFEALSCLVKATDIYNPVMLESALLKAAEEGYEPDTFRVSKVGDRVILKFTPSHYGHETVCMNQVGQPCLILRKKPAKQKIVFTEVVRLEHGQTWKSYLPDDISLWYSNVNGTEPMQRIYGTVHANGRCVVIYRRTEEVVKG